MVSKPNFTMSIDGKLRATFRVEVRLTAADIAEMQAHDTACRGEPRPFGELLQAIFKMGLVDFWQQSPLPEDEATYQREIKLG
jgi:hypothetical protein